jgi:hypothetical protein
LDFAIMSGPPRRRLMSLPGCGRTPMRCVRSPFFHSATRSSSSSPSGRLSLLQFQDFGPASSELQKAERRPRNYQN